MRIPGALAVVLLAASSCNLAPRYERPEAPVPTAWPSGAAYAEASGDMAAGLPWRQVISDAKLATVIEGALKNNRDLRAAVANVASARALYRIQRAEQIPTVTADALASVGQSGIGGDRMTNHSYRAELGIGGFELDLFGRLRNLSSAALEQYMATEAATRGARISLIAEIAITYATLAADRELLVVAEETIESAGRTLAVANRLNGAGLASKLDVTQAETVVALARSDVARYQTAIAQDRNALNLLAGGAVDESLLPDSLAALEGGVGAVPAGLSSEVLLLRPDVQQAEHLLRAATANIGAARAALFPRISLTAAIGVASTALSALFDGGFWTAAAAGSVPIFGSGARAGVAFSEAQREVFVAQYEAAIQRAFREVADGLARAGTIDEQLAAQVALVSAAEKSFGIADERYRTGIDSYLSALTAQRTFYSAKQSAISTRLEALANRITLYRVIGNDPSTAANDERRSRREPN